MKIETDGSRGEHEDSPWSDLFRDGVEVTLPTYFLHLDKQCIVHPCTSVQSIEYDTRDCMCDRSTDDMEECWVSATGLSDKAVKLIAPSPQVGVETQFCDRFGNTALHFLASRGDPEVLLSFLKKTEDFNASNSGGQTFLHALGEDWYTTHVTLLSELIILLTSARFKVQAQDVYGQNMAHLACRRIGDSNILGGLLRLLDSNTLSRRDAFGMKPEQFIEGDGMLSRTCLQIATPTLGEEDRRGGGLMLIGTRIPKHRLLMVFWPISTVTTQV
ncbi:hypothetical protein CcaCcLH18_06265 [Colletotrichum camelliae]|nr:hypothetical protein CcaCcLH18_06265 [Colletotrichum camelliae]